MTSPSGLPAAVLFDRDGTLLEDTPHNGDAGRPTAMPCARAAVAALRERRIAVGVMSNHSRIDRGQLSLPEVVQINARVEKLIGPFDVWRTCPHTEADRCRCRPPAPGLVLDASAALGIPVAHVVVIGDLGSDIAAAEAAGARAILVPTTATRSEDVSTAPAVAPDLRAAVELLLGPGQPPIAPFPGAVFEGNAIER